MAIQVFIHFVNAFMNVVADLVGGKTFKTLIKIFVEGIGNVAKVFELWPENKWLAIVLDRQVGGDVIVQAECHAKAFLFNFPNNGTCFTLIIDIVDPLILQAKTSAISTPE